jgi:hypothetical protein
MMIVVLDQDALRVDVVLWRKNLEEEGKKEWPLDASTLSGPELAHL